MVYFLVKPKKLFWKNPGVEESKENTLVFKQDKENTERKEAKFVGKLFSGDQIEKLAKDLDN